MSVGSELLLAAAWYGVRLAYLEARGGSPEKEHWADRIYREYQARRAVDLVEQK